ncbi:glycosyltransferase family 39 protein [Bacillus tianshenii]|nr:glycosyltransferase family 39 protein [Bacillus tianshenii]
MFWFVWGLVVAVSLLRLVFLTDYAASWDAVDFALGVERFDLLEMRPHFPGYPYFILGGMLLKSFVADPVEALVLFNMVLTWSSVVPVFLISRRYLLPVKAVLVVLVVQSLPFFNVLTVQPMSETAAIAVLWWYIWSLFVALETGKWRWIWLPGFFFGVLMGIRLSYLGFGIGLVWLFIKDVSGYEGNKWFRFAVHVSVNVFFQFIWVAGLVASLGGFHSFWRIALSFTEGHFEDWGGTAAADDGSVITRFAVLVTKQWLWSALFAHSWLMAGAVVVVVLGLIGARKHFIQKHFLLLFTMAGSYFLWVLFAQNIDKPRHIAPFALLIVFLLMIVILKRKTELMVVVLVGVQLFTSVSLMHERSEELPATYQLAHYLQEQSGNFIVYTWEETRVMGYLQADYPHKRLWTYHYFEEEMKDSDTETVYVTDHLLKGFQQQGMEISGQVEKVAEFHSNELFDPVYGEIKLYKWKKN